MERSAIVCVQCTGAQETVTPVLHTYTCDLYVTHPRVTAPRSHTYTLPTNNTYTMNITFVTKCDEKKNAIYVQAIAVRGIVSRMYFQ